MSDQVNGLINCAGCAFWDHPREQVSGYCRLHAPGPSYRPDEVAHWPQTRSDQGCAEGVQGPSPPRTHCAHCLFWRTPSKGLDPPDRGDMPMAWWNAAGYCARHAPSPSSEPGLRAFWRATHGGDFCAEGRARAR